MKHSKPVPQPALQRLAVLIPVWRPEPILATVVTQLAARGFRAIVLVDDGSGERYAPFFNKLVLLPRVYLLQHAVNLGKGCALKTGIRYVLASLPGIEGLITADADGQHTPEDILRVALAMSALDERAVLGSRGFAPAMPWRSRFGNALTRRIFAYLTGATLADTQSGLRAFPRAMLPELLTLPGEHYEYEMTVLAHLCRTANTPLEVPIQAVYVSGNTSSHFRPLLDSMRIYLVLARLFVSSFHRAVCG